MFAEPPAAPEVSAAPAGLVTPGAPALPTAPAPAHGEASADPVTAQVRVLLSRLPDRPVAEHAEVFADIHGVLQNALSDAGRDPAPR